MLFDRCKQLEEESNEEEQQLANVAVQGLQAENFHLHKSMAEAMQLTSGMGEKMAKFFGNARRRWRH